MCAFLIVCFFGTSILGAANAAVPSAALYGHRIVQLLLQKYTLFSSDMAVFTTAFRWMGWFVLLLSILVFAAVLCVEGLLGSRVAAAFYTGSPVKTAVPIVPVFFVSVADQPTPQMCVVLICCAVVCAAATPTRASLAVAGLAVAALVEQPGCCTEIL